MYFADDKDQKVEKITEGVTRTYLLKGEKIQIFRLEMKGNQAVPEHFHPHEQAGYVLTGVFEAVIGGEQKMLKKGDSFRIPGDVPHSGFVHEDTVMLDIYSPPRF